jgi:hypothetical protein
MTIKRVIRNDTNQAMFDVPPGTVGRANDDGGDKLKVTWSDGSWGVYKRKSLEIDDER